MRRVTDDSWRVADKHLQVSDVTPGTPLPPVLFRTDDHLCLVSLLTAGRVLLLREHQLFGWAGRADAHPFHLHRFAAVGKLQPLLDDSLAVLPIHIQFHQYRTV